MNRLIRTYLLNVGTSLMALLPIISSELSAAEPVFRAGAYAIDVSPLELPVIVNGGMTERTVDRIEDRLHARCLVLDDGTQTVAIVVVDNCMMPRSLLDEAKQMASAATSIAINRILISATHTHSAPSVHGCLGSDPDEHYSRFLPGQIAKGIVQAQKNLQPAQLGWAVGRDEKNVASRRWLMKPGVAPTNPYVGRTDDQAQMHPGYGNPDAIRPTGPVDPSVPVLAIRTARGEPLAVLTNYSMHYVGKPALSADYFSLVCDQMAKRLKAEDRQPRFMAMHSNGTSGDAWLMDYTKPRRMFTPEGVAEDVARAAYDALQGIQYYRWAPIAMEETLVTVGVRMPTTEEVTKAKEFMQTFAGRKPKDTNEVYARETVLLSQMPATRELRLQALRIGQFGIAAIPNETFGSTGLAIKEASPFKVTMNIELANGCEGYLPPPDQLALGGYETWRARTSCLDAKAEPAIRTTLIELLKKVAAARSDEPIRASD